MFSRRLRNWFSKWQRDLEFRRTRDPYAILVSETMLQQTQVRTVEGYFARFMERFPTVEALAQADEQEVLSLWAGLGYYRRARLLQQAARHIVALGCVFPQTVPELMGLPGVGRYTAGAIASFAFGARVPLVDTNVSRVLARVLGFVGPIGGTRVQKVIWEVAESLVPPEDAGIHNCAMMELGSLVCTPVKPRCNDCVVRDFCVACARGIQEKIPARVSRAPRIDKRFVCIVLRCGKLFGVRRIPSGEWHAGLFEFPKAALEDDNEDTACMTLARAFEGANVRPVEFCRLRFAVTRHRVTMHVYHARIRNRVSGLTWLSLDEIDDLPLGAAQKRIVIMLREKLDSGGM